MRVVWSIYLVFMLLLLPSGSPKAQHRVLDVAFEAIDHQSTSTDTAENVCFVVGAEANILATTPLAPHCVTPIARTLSHCARTVEHNTSQSKATNAIDSTMASLRYGLFNHKILFVSHPRLHYLNRYVRLII